MDVDDELARELPWLDDFLDRGLVTAREADEILSAHFQRVRPSAFRSQSVALSWRSW